MWQWPEIFLSPQILGRRLTNITLTGCLPWGYIDLNQLLNTELHLVPKSASTSEIKCVHGVTITCVVVMWVHGTHDGTMCPGVDSASENEYQGFLLG